MKVRVYQEPSGNLRIVRINPRLREVDESDDDCFIRIAGMAEAGDSSLQGLSFVDVDEAEIPTDRAERYKWRIQAGKCVVDKTIPDKFDPREDLKQLINAATTIAQLKVLMRELV